MSDELWFRFFPSKFMSGIRGLSANEVKVYIGLLCRMYESDGPISANREILATYCEMRPSSFDKALDRLVRLEKVFLTGDGQLFNVAAAREIAQRASKSEIAKRAAQKSVEKRQQNQGGDEASAERPLSYKRREEKRREEKGGKPPNPLEREFAEFYSAYPLKQNPKGALSKYRTARKTASHEQIMAGLASYAANKPDWQKWCAPSVWLNQERWNYEFEKPAGPASSPAQQRAQQQSDLDWQIAQRLERAGDRSRRTAGLAPADGDGDHGAGEVAGGLHPVCEADAAGHAGGVSRKVGEGGVVPARGLRAQCV